MALSYNPDYLDRHLAPGISTFTLFEAPDISVQHPGMPVLLVAHFWNSVLRGEYANKFRQYAVNQIYRAQVAFADYHEARSLTVNCLSSGRPDSPAIKMYFQALARWESCLLNVQIFIDVMNKMKKEIKDTPVFAENDGTPEQRAYSIANTIKHFGSDIMAERHAETDTVPMWLTNTGFTTRSHSLSYLELADIVSVIAECAQKITDPLSFVSPADSA